MNTALLKKVASFVLPLGVGDWLLWLVAGQWRGQGSEVRAGFRKGLGHWPWFLLALACFSLAQLLRAWRWQAMPGAPGTFWLGFRAISVSFLASLAVSRLAEVVRIVFHNRYSGVPPIGSSFFMQSHHRTGI